MPSLQERCRLRMLVLFNSTHHGWGDLSSEAYIRISGIPIHLTSLEDPATVDNVLTFLEPYVPYTLGLIGNIVNSRPNFGKPLQAQPGATTDGPTLEYDICPVGAKGRGHHIGRVHEKWVPCLNPITIQCSGPLVCLIRPCHRPPPSPPPRPLSRDPPPRTTSHTPGVNETQYPNRWIISQFRPSDIRFISPFPKHKAYLESRAHTSIPIHDTHLTNGSSEPNSNPVTWQVIQADGSFAALWVEPSHRNLGLGVLVLKECMSRLETYHGFSGKRVIGTGILVWQWVGASPENAPSLRFFLRQEGWVVG